jgi:drug/metabolite transporter (DMT)-like permease
MNRLATAFGALQAAGLELALSGLFLAVIAWNRGDFSRIAIHDRLSLFICGTFWLLNVTLSWLSVGLANNSGELLVVGILNYLWPSLTLLFAIPILHARATWWLVPGLLSVSTGIIATKMATAPADITVGALTDLNSLAYTLAVLDAIAWAIYSNLSRKLLHPKGASAVPFYMIVTSVPLLIAGTITEPLPAPTFSGTVLLFIWALATAGAYLFWDVGMRYGNVVAISTTSMCIPLLSTLITAILSNHPLSAMLLTGSALVVLGSTVCRKGVQVGERFGCGGQTLRAASCNERRFSKRGDIAGIVRPTQPSPFTQR